MMSVVLTVMNMKGGVGKTTIAMHLAGMAAMYSLGKTKPRNVLAIDYDPQFNMSQAFLSAKSYFKLEGERKTTLSILVDDDTDLDPYHLQVPGNHNPPKVGDICTSIYSRTRSGGKLDIVPSTLDLMYVALGQANARAQPIEERFRKFIQECRSKYDLIIIDCHPAGSLFTKTSLRNSDHVLIPVVPQPYSVRGIGLMMNFIAAAKTGPNGPAPHILFNATSRVDVSLEEAQIRSNKSFSAHCMINTLKRYTAFSEPEGGRGFVWFSKKPYSTQAFRNMLQVSQELMSRIGA
jgi:chromosome partitioning protein